jgi:hypothetical protein
VASHSRGFQTASAVFDWTREGNELHMYVHFLWLLLKYELKLKPFQQILEKVIQTYLLEAEMRKKL